MGHSKEMLATARDMTQALCHGFRDEYEVANINFNRRRKLSKLRSLRKRKHTSTSPFIRALTQKLNQFSTRTKTLSAILGAMLAITLVLWLGIPATAELGQELFIETVSLCLTALVVNWIITEKNPDIIDRDKDVSE